MRALLLLALVGACADRPDAAGLPLDQAPPVYQTRLYVRDAAPGGSLRITAVGLPPGALVDLYRGDEGFANDPFPGTQVGSLMDNPTRLNAGPLYADGAGVVVLDAPLLPGDAAGRTILLRPYSTDPSFTMPDVVRVWVAYPGCGDDAAESDDSDELALWLSPNDHEALRSCPNDSDRSKIWLEPGDQLVASADYERADGDVNLSIDAEAWVQGGATPTGVSATWSAVTPGFQIVRVGLSTDRGAAGLDYVLGLDVVPSPYPDHASGLPHTGRQIDLDGARIGEAGSTSLTDVLWQVATRQGQKMRELIPRGGTAVAPMGLQQPTVQGCAAASLSRARLSTPKDSPGVLADGSWFCARTADGRLARLRLGGVTVNTVTLVTSWDDAPAWTPVMWGGLTASAAPGEQGGVDLDAGRARWPGEGSDITVSYANGKWRLAPTVLPAGQQRAKLWAPAGGAGGRGAAGRRHPG
ncbi:MAG TPA: hypothetical protein PKA64_07010, partial [Myxococcota bacterium]|nr:hypothetical protein [Myxococcota bacterium]